MYDDFVNVQITLGIYIYITLKFTKSQQIDEQTLNLEISFAVSIIVFPSQACGKLFEIGPHQLSSVDGVKWRWVTALSEWQGEPI